MAGSKNRFKALLQFRYFPKFENKNQTLPSFFVWRLWNYCFPYMRISSGKIQSTPPNCRPKHRAAETEKIARCPTKMEFKKKKDGAALIRGPCEFAYDPKVDFILWVRQWAVTGRPQDEHRPVIIQPIRSHLAGRFFGVKRGL
jgi:hypothetical protein